MKISDIKFPVFTEPSTPPSTRSIDEIDAWIEQDYREFFNREAYEREKIILSVDTPFVLFDD